MKLASFFKFFAKDEAGAVTVDWVVLTAAIVGLGLVVVNTVGNGVNDMGENIAGNLASGGGTASNFSEE